MLWLLVDVLPMDTLIKEIIMTKRRLPYREQHSLILQYIAYLPHSIHCTMPFIQQLLYSEWLFFSVNFEWWLSLITVQDAWREGERETMHSNIGSLHSLGVGFLSSGSLLSDYWQGRDLGPGFPTSYRRWCPPSAQILPSHLYSL